MPIFYGIIILETFYSHHFVLPLPVGHRFPMEKYRLIHEGVRTQMPAIQCHEAPYVPDEVLALIHHQDYIDRVSDGKLTSAEQRAVGFPWSAQMVERSRRSSGATIAACRAALQYGVAANLAGGTHHAYADRGEGFCVFNDAAIAARLMQSECRVNRVVIIDLDVHQGNGTASIFKNDDSVFTLSLHGEHNYPFRKEISDLDIALPDDTGDEVYLCALRQALSSMFKHFSPELMIYLAGADPHERDRLGRLKLTFSGLEARDHMVLAAAYQQSIPVAITMAGGYGNDIHETVAVHLQTIRIGAEYAARW